MKMNSTRSQINLFYDSISEFRMCDIVSNFILNNFILLLLCFLLALIRISNRHCLIMNPAF